VGQAQRDRPPAGARDPVSARGHRLDHPQLRRGDDAVLVGLPARRGRPQSAEAVQRRARRLLDARDRALLLRQLHRPDGRGPGGGPAAAGEPYRRVNKPAEPGPLLSSLGGQSAVRAAIIFLAVVAAGALVRIFQDILSPLVVATFLLLLIDALSRDLDSRFPRLPRLARVLSAGVLIVAGFAAVIVLLVFQGPPFAIELRGVEPRVNALITMATRMLGQTSFTVRDVFGHADPSQEFAHIFAAARGALTFAGLVMIFLGFLLASRAAFSSKLDRLYESQHHRQQARRVFESIREAVEDYVRLVTFKALLIAIIAFVVMLAL